MLNIIIPLLTFLVLLSVVRSLLYAARGATIKRKLMEGRRHYTPNQLRDLVALYGKNTNSYLSLYEGFEYFTSRDERIDGVIVFVETQFSWVGAANPLCKDSNAPAFMKEFGKAAKMVGKTAMFMPVSKDTADKAAPEGYGSVMIGTEPLFDLGHYPRTGKTWIDVVPTAKQLYAKGANVKEFHPSGIPHSTRVIYDDITKEWFGTRKMNALSFLNRVEPWTHSIDKRYFSIEYKGKILAFIAAIPIWARKGWYLVDVLRRRETPAGTTELLLLEAMRLLRAQGAEEISLGVAPLAGLEDPEQRTGSSAHSALYRVLHLVFEKSVLFYSFKSLYNYKVKFDPTSSDDGYLLYYRKRLRILDAIGLFQALIPDGFMQAAWSGATRLASRFSLSEWIKGQLSKSIVVRSVPPTFERLILRCKFTAILLVLNITAFIFTTDRLGEIYPENLDRWAFSWNNLLGLKYSSLVLSPFLHWNLFHLNFNLVVLIIFCGGLEYLAGSVIVIIAFTAGAFLANPITVLVLHAILGKVPQVDVGCSLGVMSCAGAFSQFVRLRSLLLVILLLGSLGSVFVSWNGILSVNHVAAILIGVLISKLYFRG